EFSRRLRDLVTSQERPAEQDRLVEDLDGLAEQVVGQARLATLDPRTDLGPGSHLGDLVALHVVPLDLLGEADRPLHHAAGPLTPPTRLRPRRWGRSGGHIRCSGARDRSW